MAKYTFTGWKTFTIEQTFVIEADTQAQAETQLLAADSAYKLDQHWLDYNSNKVKSTDTPDFYNENDVLVETA
jgi:hypothetical protein